MLKSIQETQKLFKIESLKDDQVSIRTSKYLLSLNAEEQIEVLNAHLASLKKDLATYEDPVLQDAIGPGGEIYKTQLQLLINIIENLLSQNKYPD
ncbi:MAG: hypothetical protein ISS65_01405 [Desulfobacterales bacterium]|uniref:Uncharacterized protein n=1 Tax=Candidatus Desulfatibia profunda TaxID=2841695 RepID=A0A8J6THQ4_9BACT|nr:hypothetical protein [Candidatus Desulfatibia profunda]MBL7178851.1 hypothetical protein [Desulfobacterales bacterium]